MKTRTLFLISILIIGFFLGSLCAQNYPNGSLLWKISGNSLEKPSYLLGTFHLKSGNYLEEINGALDAIAECEQMVGEVDMTDMMKVQQQMMPAMMMSPDTTYKMLYSEAEYELVNEKMISVLGMGLEQLGVLKPSAIQTTIVSIICQKLIPDFDAENPMDVAIRKMGQKENKPILSLELVEDQILALFGTSLRRQADLLLCNMQNLDEVGEQAAILMIENYDKGDLNALYSESFQDDNSPCPSTTEEKNALLKHRNDKWMEKLPEIMKDKSSFIAVGALHLAGEEGLLYQLKQLGYTVEPVE